MLPNAECLNCELLFALHEKKQPKNTQKKIKLYMLPNAECLNYELLFALHGKNSHKTQKNKLFFACSQIQNFQIYQKRITVDKTKIRKKKYTVFPWCQNFLPLCTFFDVFEIFWLKIFMPGATPPNHYFQNFQIKNKTKILIYWWYKKNGHFWFSHVSPTRNPNHRRYHLRSF